MWHEFGNATSIGQWRNYCISTFTCKITVNFFMVTDKKKIPTMDEDRLYFVTKSCAQR